MFQAVALFKSYFGGAFDEDAIRNNFVLIYELLDGMRRLHCFQVGEKLDVLWSTNLEKKLLLLSSPKIPIILTNLS